jgi:hypothetical protein
MDWNNNLINLRDMLADFYLFQDESVRVAREAGLKVSLIKFQKSAVDNWYFILDFARHDPASVNKLIDIAVKEFPAQKDALTAAKQGELNYVRGKDIATEVQWQNPIDAGQLEKIIGRKSTLMPISFLEIGTQKARSVVRVERANGESGSGFLTRGLSKAGAEADILVTNNHVLENKGQAADAKVQFNFQRTPQGLAAPAETFVLDTDGQFATSLDDDWTAVMVKPDAGGKPASEKWGSLPLSKRSPQKDDFTIIVQHPDGRPKEIALFNSIIAYVSDRLVQYLTDTEPGSSGSPVFDTRWNVIGLHHSGGWLREPTGDPKQTFFRNEGIHINAVIDGLASKGIIKV